MRGPGAPVAIALIAVIIAVACPVFAQDKPAASMFLHDATHSSTPAEELEAPLTLSWKHTLQQDGRSGAQHMVSSPAVDEDSVYFFIGNQMHALWRDTGAPKWEKPLEMPTSDSVDSTPLIVNDTAVVGSRDGKLYFLQVGPTAGRIVGSFDLKRQHTKLKKSAVQQATPVRVQSSPIYHDGTVFFGGTDGWVYALDMATQEKVWEFHTKAPVVASPAYWNHGIYVASLDGRVYGLSEQTGRVIWKSTLENMDLLVSPVISRSKVVVAAGKFVYACEHGVPGYVRWRFEAKGNVVGTPAICDDKVVFGDSEGKCYAIAMGAEGNIAYDDVDGEYIVWQVPAEESEDSQGGGGADLLVTVDGLAKPVRSSPIVCGNAVLYRAGGRQINGYGIEDGTLLWHYDLSELAGQAPVPTTTTTGLNQRGLRSLASPTGMRGMPTAGGQPGGAPGGLGAMGAGGGAGGIGGTGSLLTSRSVRATAPTLVFENEVSSSAFAVGDSVFVLGDDSALYAFSVKAADAVPPELYGAGIEVPGSGTARSNQDLTAYRTAQEAGDAENAPQLRGALPVYLRVRVLDEGIGVDPQSISVVQAQGGGPVNWEPAFDADGAYVWAICEARRGVARNLADGDYVVTLKIADWAGNEGQVSVAFKIDNSAPAPSASPRRRGRGGAGMPGMPGGGGMPGMPGGGGMPGMPGGGGMPGMPGMPGGGGMPGMPGMP